MKNIYHLLKNAPQGSKERILFDFICKKYNLYKVYLDSNFLSAIEHNDFCGRYWELLSICMLKENYKLEIRKPHFLKKAAKYDLEILKDGYNIAWENTVIKDTVEEEDKVPRIKYWNPSLGELPEATIIDMSFEKMQLRISNAISNKRKQYQDIDIPTDKIYILGLGLYDRSLDYSHVRDFLGLKTAYFGAFFPIGEPIVYVKNPLYEGNDDSLIKESPSATYKSENIKANSTSIRKDIFCNPEYAFISAVVLSVFCDQGLLMNGDDTLQNDFILIHNPLANNPLPPQLLPVNCEHIAYKNLDSIHIHSL